MDARLVSIIVWLYTTEGVFFILMVRYTYVVKGMYLVEFEAVMVLHEIMVITVTVITLVMHLVGKVEDIKTLKT